jgi:flagellar biosynthesis chaperone FliJ
MSSSAPLKSLLAVKQAAETAATEALAVAVQRRAAAEANQRRLDTELATARDDLQSRRRSGESTGGVETAARAAERERFWGRLADEIGRRSLRAEAHRAGPLAESRASVEAAQVAHGGARDAREVVQKLFDKAEATQRLIATRREETASDEVAATRNPRPVPRPAR